MNNRMMRKLIFILAVVLTLPAAGQRKKTDSATIPVVAEGITYSLPRTGFNIRVEAVKETFEPGPYAALAVQLLGITDAKTRPSVKWTISQIQYDTFSEPDPEQVFKSMGSGAFMVDLTASGCLAGINSRQSSGQMTAAATFSHLGAVVKNDGFSFSNILSNAVSAQADSVRRRVRISSDGLAADAAKRIMECRNLRYQIVAGLLDEYHPDGEAYKVSLNELEQIEKEYLSLFIGRTTYQTHRTGFNFVPTSASEKGEVVFRFSEEGGILPASNLAGKPVIIRVEPEKALVSQLAGVSQSVDPAAGKSGIFYRLPAIANVSFIYELNTISTSRTILPQFGQVAPVPEELLQGGYSIEIHPETGGVKSVYKK
jgi:hypothetical protein